MAAPSSATTVTIATADGDDRNEVSPSQLSTPTAVEHGRGEPHSPPTVEVLLLSTADWNTPLWTNKQYMGRELARDHHVTYVESLGLRRPQWTRRDFSRMRKRLMAAVRPARRQPSSSTTPTLTPPDGLDVVSPLVIPHHRGLSRLVNRMVLYRSVRPWIRQRDTPRLVWTYTPTTYGLERYADHCVYHCVDLLSEFPGIDRTVIDREERRLARRGATAIASSREVADHLRRQGFSDVMLWPNVADVERFTRADTALRNPHSVVFGGNLSPHKLDARWLLHLLGSAPEVTLDIAGPIADGGGQRWAELDVVLRHPRVRHHGVLDVDALAELYSRASVGVIPYVDNNYTRGVNPLKVAEYLGAGLGVVSSPIPAIRDLVADNTDAAIDVDVAEDAEAFTRQVLLRLGTPSDSDLCRRRRTADTMSWQRRGHEARMLVSRLATDTAGRPLSLIGAAVKRIIDIVGAGVALVISSPIMVVVALTIAIVDGRPILFRQRRTGKNGRPFDVWKFRTMRPGADSEVADSGWLADQFRSNGYKLGTTDPRITPLGRHLRRWSVDELPQLVNVIRGDMSLVGIRPLPETELAVRPHRDQRLYRRLRPGLTGLWQVSGRSAVDEQHRWHLDRMYSSDVRLSSDLKILVRTVSAVLSRRGSC